MSALSARIRVACASIDAKARRQIRTTCGSSELGHFVHIIVIIIIIICMHPPGLWCNRLMCQRAIVVSASNVSISARQLGEKPLPHPMNILLIRLHRLCGHMKMEFFICAVRTHTRTTHVANEYNAAVEH